VAIADFNMDGNLDVAVANQGSNTVGILNGKGDGTFKAQVTYAVGSMPQYLGVGDINADGRPDIVVANDGASNISVLINYCQ
jgi:hypothetical protein